MNYPTREECEKAITAPAEPFAAETIGETAWKVTCNALSNFAHLFLAMHDALDAKDAEIKVLKYRAKEIERQNTGILKKALERHEEIARLTALVPKDVNPKIRGGVLYGFEYDVCTCGSYVSPDNKYCRLCGAKLDWS